MCFSEYWRNRQMRYNEAMRDDIQLNENNNPRGYYLRCPFWVSRLRRSFFRKFRTQSDESGLKSDLKKLSMCAL